MDTFPVLYILARSYATDLPSCNAGKLAAQCSHASNAFVHSMNVGDKEYLGKELTNNDELFNKWQLETPQGFGTVLVLAVNETQMRTAVKVATALDLVSGVVNDPTYPAHLDAEAAVMIPAETWTLDPIPAGDKMVTFRSEDTCSYIFGDKNDPMLSAVVGRFPLHP